MQLDLAREAIASGCMSATAQPPVKLCYPHSRNIDDELFVCIALQFGLIIEPLSPRLLHYCLAGAELRLVQGCDVVKVDVRVQRELQGRRYVIRVVMLAIVVMVMMTPVPAVLIVAMMRHLRNVLCGIVLTG